LELYLARNLKLKDSVPILFSSMVGSGVFVTTGIVYGILEDPWLVLLAWILGALFSVAGAFTFAKLAILFPFAGGEYVYLRKAYSPLVAFLNGWASLLITFSASISVLGLAFGEYLSFLLPYESSHTFFRFEILGVAIQFGYPGLVGVIAIFVFTFINYFGIQKASFIQNAIFVLQILGFLLFSVSAIVFMGEEGLSKFPEFPDLAKVLSRSTSLYTAIIPVIFSYLGWNMVTYIAEEVVEPEKNISRTILLGTLLVSVLYLLVNFGFLITLEPPVLAANEGIGIRASMAVFGNSGKIYFSLFFCIVILGSLSASIIGGSRIYFAMARDGLFFPFLSKVHVHYKSPYNSLIFQAVYASMFVVFDLEFLLYTITAAILLLSALTAFSVFVFERRGLESRYKIPFHPFTPLLYIGGCLYLVYHLSIENPSQAGFGILILLTGIPVYFLFKKKFTIYQSSYEKVQKTIQSSVQ